MILGEPDKPSLEEVLEHYGVPGMKWGKHKARSLQESRTVKRAAREKQYQSDRVVRTASVTAQRSKAASDLANAKGVRQNVKAAVAARDTEIKTARLTAPDLRRDVLDANTSYKSIRKANGRKDAGTKAAKQILREKQILEFKNFDLSMQKTGEEFLNEQAFILATKLATRR